MVATVPPAETLIAGVSAAKRTSAAPPSPPLAVTVRLVVWPGRQVMAAGLAVAESVGTTVTAMPALRDWAPLVAVTVTTAVPGDAQVIVAPPTPPSATTAFAFDAVHVTWRAPNPPLT